MKKDATLTDELQLKFTRNKKKRVKARKVQRTLIFSETKNFQAMKIISSDLNFNYCQLYFQTKSLSPLIIQNMSKNEREIKAKTKNSIKFCVKTVSKQ